MEEASVADFLKPERLLRATVRLWAGRPDKGGTFLGTAFFVAPRQALTAAHSLVGIPTETLNLHLTWRGGFYARVRSVRFAEGLVDAALLEISAEAAASADSIVTVGEALPLTIGTPLRIAGFADTGSSAEIRPASVTGQDAQANATIIDPPPAKGMSGGPALSPDGLLRGMIWARDQDKGRGYLTPLSALRPLLAAVENADVAPARMLEYPALIEDRKRLAQARALLLHWRGLYADRLTELKAAAQQARIFQRSQGIPPYNEALRLAEFANSIADSIKMLPVEKLEFATHYGLGVHRAVFGGLAFLVIGSALKHLQDASEAEKDEYAFEMMARVLESAVAMLAFRPDELPQGFIEPSSAMNSAAIGAAPWLMIGCEQPVNELKLISNNAQPVTVGSFVARPLRLHVEAARRMADGAVEVLATDFQHRYRWSTNSPRPTAQYASAETLFAAFPSSTPGSSPVIGRSDGAIVELYLDGNTNELREAEAGNSWIGGAVWHDPEESEAVYILHLSNVGRMRSIRLGSSDQPVERSFAEACSDPAGGGVTWSMSNNQTRIDMLDVEGFPCALVTSHLLAWTSLLFVHPIRLQPIKPMRRILGKIMDCTVAAGRWLIVSHYGVRRGENLVSIYDLSAEGDSVAGGLSYQGSDIADVIDLSARVTGRDACEIFFVRNLLYPASKYRLCRWSWPENRFEEFPDYAIERLFPVQV